MSMSVEVVMVAPALPLANALSDILRRWEEIGYVSRDPVYSLGAEEAAVDFSDGWVERVNALPGLSFSAHRAGPPIDAHLWKGCPEVLQAGFGMTSGLFEGLYRAKSLPENWVAPLLRAALALGARYGVGGLELEIDPAREEDVEAEIRAGRWLGFVRFDAPRADELRARPGYTVTERPEGFWWLESEHFHGFFGS